MTNQTVSCDDEALRLVLEGDENSEAYRRAAIHIESCAACQRRLTELSADTGHWRSQQEMLQPVDGDDSESGYLSRFDRLETERRRKGMVDESTIKDLLSTPSHPEMLGRLGRYEIERIIGSGGMGVVLKGFDTELNRPVAIKLLAPHLAMVGAARHRFAREARAAAAVVHEHVVPIHNVESDNTTPFLVMQFVSGESLQARLDREGPLSVVEILRISMQAAFGLAAAHGQGLVHRDVKPANILLEDGVERAYLSDFGLARAVDDASATCTGVIAGTPHYMSPEQVNGATVDARSDLFGLGCSMYAMCTGRPPFRGDNSFAVLRSITDKNPQAIREINPEIPEWLCTIISRLMEKSPDARYSSAKEVADLLERCLAHVQEPTVKDLPAEVANSRRGSGAIGKWILALAGFGLVGLFGLGLLQTNPPDIAGDWIGQGEWGQVNIKKDDQGAWKGTFTDTTSEGPGQFTLKWSRVSRRFDGTWSEGADKPFGDLSIRLVNGEIRGAYSLDKKFQTEPEASHLADLHWIRGKVEPQITSTAPAEKAKTKNAAPSDRIGRFSQMAYVLINRQLPLDERERRAEALKRPLTGIHFAISKDRKYYAQAFVTPPARPQIAVFDAAAGDVVARHLVETPLGALEFTEEGIATWEADGSQKLRLSFKDIEAKIASDKEKYGTRDQSEMTLEETPIRLAGIDVLKKYGHFLVSDDGKYFAFANANYPHGPFELRLHDSATGKLIGSDRPENLVGPFQFTPEGLASKETDGQVVLRISFKAKEQAARNLNKPIPLKDVKSRISNFQLIERHGHFVVSSDGKLYGIASGNYPDGPSWIEVRDAESGEKLGEFMTEKVAGPLQFTEEGLATREAEGKLILRVPLKSRAPSPGGDEEKPQGTDEPKSPSIKEGGALDTRPDGNGWDAMIAQLRKTGLDVLIVFDSTGSMDGEIGQLKRHIERTFTAIQRSVPKTRIGLTTYRDRGEEYVAFGLPLTSDIDKIEKFLDRVRADSGGDLAEAVDAGMEWSLTHNSFEPGARKLMIVFGDAPPHRERQRACESMAREFREKQKGVVTTISCRSPSPMSEFKGIADGGSGDTLFTTDTKQFMTELLTAIFGNAHRDEVVKAFQLSRPKL